MVIYLKHPKHGTKVAIAEEEAKADEKNGWERLKVVVEPPKPAEAKPVNALAEEAQIRALYVEKFGKRPHHKKSIEALKGELAAYGPFNDRAFA